MSSQLSQTIYDNTSKVGGMDRTSPEFTQINFSSKYNIASNDHIAAQEDRKRAESSAMDPASPQIMKPVALPSTTKKNNALSKSVSKKQQNGQPVGGGAIGSPNVQKKKSSRNTRLTQSIDVSLMNDKLPNMAVNNRNGTRLSVSPTGRGSQASSVIIKEGNGGNNGKLDSMAMQKLISQGDVDYASWRKRKQQRLEREAEKLGARGVAMSALKNQKSKRPQKFDYVDPVDDVARLERNAGLANTSQMKWHEMKVERGGPRATPSNLNPQQQNSSLQAVSAADANSLQNAAAALAPEKQFSRPDALRHQRETLVSNYELDKIERKVTAIMQKYCTPVHPGTSRFEPLGRFSVLDRASSSLSRMMDSGPGGANPRNHPQNQTMQGFGVDHLRHNNKTDLSTKHSTAGPPKNLSTNIHIGSQSVRNNSIAEVIDMHNQRRVTVDHNMDDDKMVIAPANTTSVRNSMAIRAKLRPLLNDERIEQTSVFMQEFGVLREDHAKKLNKRKSMSKRVNQSFTVDTDAVQRRVERGTREENLPSNRYLKVQKMAEKKKQRKNLDDPGEVMGWTEISEEQDFATSDFDNTFMFENQNSHSKLTKLKDNDNIGLVKNITASSPSIDTGKQMAPLASKRVKKGKITNVQLLTKDSESHNRFETMKDDSPLQKTAEEVDDSNEDEAENQILNPELIGASHALKQGDLAMYDQIMSGRKAINVEDLMQIDAEETGNDLKLDQINSDSELAAEVGKFDDIAYKKNPEQLAESQTLDNMIKFDKTFKMVMDHVRKMLDISHIDLNKHIEKSIMGVQAEPSPLLKYYNELLQNTNFMLPNRHKLDFDQQVFRKTIDKITKAHKKELDWVKNLVVHESRKHLEDRFKQTSQILADECSNLLNQFESVKDELTIAVKNERFLHQKLFQSEMRLMQMRSHIDEYKLFIKGQEEELSQPIKPNMRRTNKGMSEMVPEVLVKRDKSGKNKKQHELEDKSKWPKPHLRLVHPQQEIDNPGSRKKQATANNDKFEKEYGKVFMPKDNQGLYRDPGLVNPYLKLNQLGFFGAHVTLTIEDKARVLESELIRDYQMRLREAQDEKEAASQEHEVIRKFFNEIKDLSDSRQIKIVELRQELAAKEKQRVQENADWQEKYDMDIDAIETTYSNKLKQCKQLFSCEVEVLTQICQLQQDDVIKNRVQMKQIATLLRIPRAHHAYITKYGAYDFINKCEDIVANNDANRQREQQRKDRAIERQKVAWDRKSKQMRGSSMPVEIPLPIFNRDKQIEREKLQDYIKEKKQDQERLKLQQKSEFKGKLDHKVKIDETLIDLTDTPANVQAKIQNAMTLKDLNADLSLTEHKIDQIRSSNMAPNEINKSVFTSVLEHFINNVGMKLPYDSDPGFYKDHYDKEVKARQGLKEDDDFYVSERISGRESAKTQDHKSEDDIKAHEGIIKVREHNFNERSGYTSRLTTQADEKTTQKQSHQDGVKNVSKKLFIDQSQDFGPPAKLWQKRALQSNSGDIMDMRTSVQSINNSQMFNFTLKNLKLNNQSKNLKLASNAQISNQKSSSSKSPDIPESPSKEKKLNETFLTIRTHKQNPTAGHKFTVNWQQQRSSGRHLNLSKNEMLVSPSIRGAETLYGTQSSLKSSANNYRTSNRRIRELDVSDGPTNAGMTGAVAPRVVTGFELHHGSLGSSTGDTKDGVTTIVREEDGSLLSNLNNEELLASSGMQKRLSAINDEVRAVDMVDNE